MRKNLGNLYNEIDDMCVEYSNDDKMWPTLNVMRKVLQIASVTPSDEVRKTMAKILGHITSYAK